MVIDFNVAARLSDNFCNFILLTWETLDSLKFTFYNLDESRVRITFNGYSTSSTVLGSWGMGNYYVLGISDNFDKQ